MQSIDNYELTNKLTVSGTSSMEASSTMIKSASIGSLRRISIVPASAAINFSSL